MSVNRSNFYSRLRSDKVLFPLGLQQSAVDTIEAALTEFESRGMTDLRHLAYMLATARGEVGAAMKPVREGFKSTDADARAYVKRNFPHYAMVINGQVYYGRGLVQLTWERNYKVMSTLLGIDLVNNPDLALEPEVAVQILFEGMLRGASGRGDFTGKALEDYFNDKTEDWVNARRIINGLDKAAQFAAWGKRFHQHLKASWTDAIVLASSPEPVTSEPVEPMSYFRKAIFWVFGPGSVIGSAAAGAASWFNTLNPVVASTMVVTLGVVSLVAVGLVFWMKRPIVIQK